MRELERDVWKQRVLSILECRDNVPDVWIDYQQDEYGPGHRPMSGDLLDFWREHDSRDWPCTDEVTETSAHFCAIMLEEYFEACGDDELPNVWVKWLSENDRVEAFDVDYQDWDIEVVIDRSSTFASNVNDPTIEFAAKFGFTQTSEGEFAGVGLRKLTKS